MQTILQVVIQFIGLAVFSQQIPGDPGVHVLFPAVIVGGVSTERAISIKPLHTTGVEPHAAIFAFPTSDLSFVSGWQAAPLPRVPGYSHVRLNGERVTFIGNGMTGAPYVPQKLPNLTAICPNTQNLDAGYLPPYAAAAAVFDIPAGILKACRATTPTDGTTSRVDTRLSFNVSGPLVIVGTKGAQTKVLILNVSGTLVAGNVPTRFLETTGTFAQVGPAHGNAYQHLGPPSSVGCSAITTSVSDACDSPMQQQAEGAKVIPVTGIFSIIDSQCSNTQWP